MVGVREGVAGRLAQTWVEFRTWSSYWVTGWVVLLMALSPFPPPFPCLISLPFLTTDSYSDCLPLFFFTKFSHEGLGTCYSFCARSLSPQCPVGSLHCFLQVSAQLSVCRRTSLTASYKIATSHSLVLLSHLIFPLSTFYPLALYIHLFV